MTWLELALVVLVAGLIASWIHEERRARAMDVNCPNCRHYASACDACWEGGAS